MPTEDEQFYTHIQNAMQILSDLNNPLTLTRVVIKFQIT